MELPFRERVVSVSEAVGALSRRVREAFPDLSVEGEVSNLGRPSSGHLYLTLKDEGAQLRAVIWRSVASTLPFRLEDGQHVIARGGLTVYAERGAVQLVISSVRPVGEGALRQALEVLRRRLDAEGLFDAARKRSLPVLPQTVGIVTSGTGAAVHDILSVLERRWPAVRVLLAPVRVQGEGACDEIAAAIRTFNRLAPETGRRPDVLIVGRGGGSLEDLWAFNEESVVRAIHASAIPVVSGVGHESDTTLADLAADVRAATPSAAAERVVPTRESYVATMHGLLAQADRQAGRVLERRRHALDVLSRRLAFHSPAERVHRHAQKTDELGLRLERAIGHAMRRSGERWTSLSRRLATLDPLRPLQAGFALVTGEAGVIRSASSLEAGDSLSLRFADGAARATVDHVEPRARD